MSKDIYNKACDNAFNKLKESELDTLNMNCWSKYDKKGFLSSDTKLFIYNNKGKIIKTINLKKRFTNEGSILKLSVWKKNYLVISVFYPGKGVKNYLYNTKKYKIVKKYKGYNGEGADIDGKYMYVLPRKDKSGNEYIKKISVKTGKTVSKINLTRFKGQANSKEKDVNKNCTIAAYGGKCFLKNDEGIYCWNADKKVVVQLINRNNGFSVPEGVGGNFFAYKGILYLMDTDYFTMYKYKL